MILGQFFEVAFDQIGQLPQHAPALGRADLGPAPLVEGAPGSGDRDINILFISFGDISDDRPGRRVVNRKGLTRRGRDELAVDQHQRGLAEKPCRVAQPRIEFKRVHVHSSHLTRRDLTARNGGTSACLIPTAAPISLYPSTYIDFSLP
jgi:hypothetical protein